MLYGWALSGILLLTTFGVSMWKDKQIDALEAAIDTQRDTIAVMKVTAGRSTIALADCQAVNDKNAAARDRATRRAEEAVSQARVAGQLAEARIAETNEFMKEYRENAGNECYRLAGDELPADFVKRVFRPASLRADH